MLDLAINDTKNSQSVRPLAECNELVLTEDIVHIVDPTDVQQHKGNISSEPTVLAGAALAGAMAAFAGLTGPGTACKHIVTPGRSASCPA
jgi:hypothetical protein